MLLTQWATNPKSEDKRDLAAMTAGDWRPRPPCVIGLITFLQLIFTRLDFFPLKKDVHTVVINWP